MTLTSRQIGTRLAAAILSLPALRAPTAIAQTPAVEQPGDLPAASPNGRIPVTVEDLARRLQRFEEQNAKLAEQNATLADQNRSMARKLEKLSSQYDQLSSRLERLGPDAGLRTPNVPAPVPPESRPAGGEASRVRSDLAPLRDAK